MAKAKKASIGTGRFAPLVVKAVVELTTKTGKLPTLSDIHKALPSVTLDDGRVAAIGSPAELGRRIATWASSEHAQAGNMIALRDAIIKVHPNDSKLFSATVSPEKQAVADKAALEQALAKALTA